MTDATPASGCPQCAILMAIIEKQAAQIAKLEARIYELEKRLAQNSSNSHKPPSSDPPWKPKPAQPKPTGRKPGGQPGHKGTTRPLAPEDQVDEFRHVKPAECRACGHELVGDDPCPTRKQTVDLPQIRPTITEYRIHSLACPCCSVTTVGELPRTAAGVFGPRVKTLATLLTGTYRLPRRVTERLLSDLFGLEVSLGSLSTFEGEMADALAAPYTEACAAAQAASTKHADETGWAEKNRLAWMWVLATAVATVYLVRNSRGSDSAQELLGDGSGVVVADRWSGYNWLPVERRQLCWAHLLRDFQKLAESKDPFAGLGEALLAAGRRVFELWSRVRDGTLTRACFERDVGPLRAAIRDYLAAGRAIGHGRESALCRGILRLEPAMWTFVHTPGVEPTNNAAERALRPVVLWRKTSYGSRSEAGHAFVERMLTVVATLRQHGRSVVEYLHDAYVAFVNGAAAPALVPCRA